MFVYLLNSSCEYQSRPKLLICVVMGLMHGFFEQDMEQFY